VPRTRRAVLVVETDVGTLLKPGALEPEGEGGAPEKEGQKKPDTDRQPPGEKSTKPGSKYGWLDWIQLPPDVIRALEAAFEALEGDSEWIELKETLVALTDLAQHGDQVKALLDVDTLLPILLGLESNTAVDRLAEWATRPPRVRARRRRATGSGRKLANALANVIDKLHRVLRPLFKGRERFIDVIGRLGAIVEALPVLEELFDLARDRQRAGEKVDRLLEAVSDQVSEAVKENLVQARGALTFHVEHFTADDMIKHEQIAEVATELALKFVKGPYRAVVRIARETGLQGLVARHLVAKILPEHLTRSLNDAIGAMIEQLQPTIEEVQKQLDALLGEAELAIREQLGPQLRDVVLMPSGRSATPAQERPAVHLAAPAAGEALDEATQADMEERLGTDLSRVRIHRDASAGDAARRVGADAFTVGEQIYFAAGAYQPDS
jgi:hypothetical protein